LLSLPVLAFGMAGVVAVTVVVVVDVVVDVCWHCPWCADAGESPLVLPVMSVPLSVLGIGTPRAMPTHIDNDINNHDNGNGNDTGHAKGKHGQRQQPRLRLH
jgi:hypothetical protein